METQRGDTEVMQFATGILDQDSDLVFWTLSPDLSQIATSISEVRTGGLADKAKGPRQYLEQIRWG